MAEPMVCTVCRDGAAGLAFDRCHFVCDECFRMMESDNEEQVSNPVPQEDNQ